MPSGTSRACGCGTRRICGVFRVESLLYGRLVRLIFQRSRMSHDRAERLHATQIMELRIRADAVAMVGHEPTAVRHFMYDCCHCQSLRWRHPRAGASEFNLRNCLLTHLHVDSKGTIRYDLILRRAGDSNARSHIAWARL